MSDPSKVSQQELVDYLVQAVEEEDVLFCVLWLQEMARRGLVCSREGELKADGINLEHSWKKRSALVIAVSGPPTNLRQFILTLLLVHVRDVMSCAVMSAAIELRAIWAVSILNSWESPAVHGTSIVRTPRELLAMSAAEAANWIDANLPAHPSPESSTGCGPLPDPPQRNEARSSSLTQAYPAPTAAALPTVPPGFTVPPTASLADRQVRLCEIASVINIGRLCRLLPPIEGLRETPPQPDVGVSQGSDKGSREKPQRISAQHPIVVIRNLPSYWGYHVVYNLSRLTRLGAYGEAMQPLGDGSAIGRFRVSSPATAQEAADMLNGMEIDGVTISADWTNGDGSAPSRAPQSTTDATGGQLASFTATEAIPADSQPATATAAPMPALPAAEEHTASSQTSATKTTAAAPATIAVASPTTQRPVVQPLHMPPSPLSTPAPETQSLPEPFALPASSYSTPATFVANVTPPVSPATVTKGLLSTTGDLWGQELQGRRKASSDGGGEEERAAKRRK